MFLYYEFIPRFYRLIVFVFQLVTSYTPGKGQYSTALRVCNQSKNRSADLIATDCSRVFLTPNPELDGEDYINASYVSGEFKENYIWII